MRTELMMLTVLLLLIPALILAALGGNFGAVGLVGLLLAVTILPASFTRFDISKFAWLSFGLVAVVLLFGSGLVAQALPLFYLQRAQGGALSTSVLALELAAISATLFMIHKKGSDEFAKAGYDEKEAALVLDGFTMSLLEFAVLALVVSVALFFVLRLTPLLQIDPLTALIISALIYFIVAKAILGNRSGIRPDKVDQLVINRTGPAAAQD